MLTMLAQLPAVPSGVALFYEVQVVVPVARTNIAKNPSLETSSNGWAAATGSSGFTRTTTESCYGAYSLQGTVTLADDGVYYDDSTAFAGGSTPYAVSVALLGQPGRTYEISVRSTAGVSQRAERYEASGFWERIWLPYVEGVGANRRVYITQVSAGSGSFYVDGLQIELCATGQHWPTTYIDGDQPGLIPNESPPAYGWAGTPHASTSYRTAQTRAGGRLRSFSEFGFTASALIGLGLDTPDHDLVPFSVLDGAQYNDTRKPPRPFTFVGRFDGSDEAELRRARGGLARLLDRDLIARRQPLTLHLTLRDECGRQLGKAGRLIALYTGGLEGNHSNPWAEEAAISFTTVQQNAIQGSDAGAAYVTVVDSLALDHVVQRSPGAVWSRLGSGADFNGTVRALAEGPDGRVYAAGDFTSTAGGVAANRIAYWDGSAWNAMGTGANGVVRALAVGLDGQIYAAGDFTSMGGVANTSRIARWDGSAWNALSTGAAANEIYALAVGQDGKLYAAGTFTSIGGVGANRIAYWDGSAWNAMGTGAAAGTVYALAVMLDGSIVAAGSFTNMGGVGDADRIARWNGSAWVGLSTGLNGDGRALAVAADGTLYAGGAFTTAGGVAASHIAMWNGAQWQPMGSGTQTGGFGSSGDVYTLAYDLLADMVYAAGDFHSMDDLPQTPRYARWNGSNWVPGDVLAIVGYILDILVRPDGTVVYGVDSAASFWQIPVLLTVTNDGTAYTYPKLIFYGASLATFQAVTFFNVTTGAVLNFSLASYGPERVVVDCDPTQFKVTSSVRGLITGSVLLGSSVSDFALQPGANVLGVLLQNGPAAYVTWPELYLAADDLVPGGP
jgi:hypothetical protein